jgi:hypothetical protein
VRIVNDDHATAFTRQRTADRCGKAIAAMIVVEAYLGVLIARDLEPVAPEALIERAFDQAAGLNTIADG